MRDKAGRYPVPGYGLLAKDSSLPAERHGVRWRPMDTRPEEYNIVADLAASLPPGRWLDLGTGWLENVHIAPELLAACGHEVLALDTDRRALKLPESDQISRRLHDMFELESLDEPPRSFDHALCLSVIEHTPRAKWPRLVAGLVPLLRPGALLYISGDWTDPEEWPRLLEPAFDVGARWPDPAETICAGNRDEPTSLCVAVRR